VARERRVRPRRFVQVENAGGDHAETDRAQGHGNHEKQVMGDAQ